MRPLKALIFSFGILIAAVVAGPTEANAQLVSQTPILPTANKLIYSTNAVEVQDSVNKKAVVYKKGTFYVITSGFSGGTAALIDNHSQRAVWRGKVNTIRIVGVANTDSLKILSLKATPF